MSLPPELAFVFGETSNVFQRARVIFHEMVAESTLALTIERPEDFVFKAGDNTMVSIPGAHADDLKEFTIASAPYEKDLVLAMRVRNSNFKNACYALKHGDALNVRSPAGTIWHATESPQIWLSGGIGTTPFRSIIRELIHTHASLSIIHIHSDRSRASIPYLSEFESYATEHETFEFISTTTREKGQGSLSGRITSNMIATHAPHYTESYFFVVGTDSFVGSMRKELTELDISAEKIRTERFDGYKVC